MQVAPEDANVQAMIVSTEMSIYQQMPYPQPGTSAQIQAKEADVQALAEFTRALDKKVDQHALYFFPFLVGRGVGSWGLGFMLEIIFFASHGMKFYSLSNTSYSCLLIAIAFLASNFSASFHTNLLSVSRLTARPNLLPTSLKKMSFL